VHNSNVINAIKSWQNLLGLEYVVVEDTTIQNLETATFKTHQNITAILLPHNIDEIQACVKIANTNKVPLYPISTGHNWGYGSSVPPWANCALLDLSRLNQILDFNEDLAYVTLEPGVTQQQLFQFLQDQGSKLWMDATGSSPHCSIIGNTLERGFGHTPYGDHFAHSCGVEVILPNGDLIHTGFGRFANAHAAPVYRWGIGPYLDGLFSQSNLGIVTKMTLWLMPKPEYFQAFYFSIYETHQLNALIDGLRPLRLNGTLESAIHIGNDYKVLSSIRQYPWQEAAGQTPLPEATFKALKQNWQLGDWSGSGGIYGTRRQVAEARRLIRNNLKGTVNKLIFLDDVMLNFADQVAQSYQWLTKRNRLTSMLKLMRPVYGLMKGIPTETQIGSTYWRKKYPVPSSPDPDRDKCGLLWCAPIAPLTGQHARRLQEITYEVLAEHFEPMISFTLLSGRSLGCLITIAYDREVEGEDERAMSCYADLRDRLNNAGYYAYRKGIQSMGQEPLDSYSNVLHLIKKALDPASVLSPGRYIDEESSKINFKTLS
jgi:4-cresol dehydrogenase (hydroxylating) flavoprotein subunit